MDKIEKELLLKDLSARLPYGVKFQGEDSKVYTLDAANYFALQVEDVIFKPYLRPLSSMTEEEKKEHDFYCGYKPYDENIRESYLTEYDMPDYVDWLNEHHFDYRELIPMGLALEAPEGMYKID